MHIYSLLVSVPVPMIAAELGTVVQISLFPPTLTTTGLKLDLAGIEMSMAQVEPSLPIEAKPMVVNPVSE